MDVRDQSAGGNLTASGGLVIPSCHVSRLQRRTMNESFRRAT